MSTGHSNPAPYSFRRFSPYGGSAKNPKTVTNPNDNDVSKSGEKDIGKIAQEEITVHDTETKLIYDPVYNNTGGSQILVDKQDKMPLKKLDEDDLIKTAPARKYTPAKSPENSILGRIQNKNFAKKDPVLNNKNFFSNKYQSKSPILTRASNVEISEAKKVVFGIKKSLSPTQTVFSTKQVTSKKGVDLKFSKPNKDLKQFESEVVKLSSRDNNITEGPSNQLQGLVFKNQLLEKINSDLAENGDQSKGNPSDSNDKKNGPKPISFARFISNAADQSKLSNFNSNFKPLNVVPKMPINKKGEFSSKWQSIQAPKTENRISLGMKVNARNNDSTLKNTGDVKTDDLENNFKPSLIPTEESKAIESLAQNSGVREMMSNSPTRNMIFKSLAMRERSPLREDNASIKIRKKTLKIDRVNVDKKISKLIEKMVDDKTESDLADSSNTKDDQMVSEIKAETQEEELKHDERASDNTLEQKLDEKKTDSALSGSIPTTDSQAKPIQIRKPSKPRTLENRKDITEILASLKMAKEDAYQNQSKVGTEKDVKTHSSTSRSNSNSIASGARTGQHVDITESFEIIKQIEIKTDHFPPVLNSFMKFEAAPHIYAIGYNSHQGYVRDYNEDRIAVVFSDKLMNNNKIANYLSEPPISFGLYSIFDGHNGFECSEFLKNNLHNVLLDQAFSSRKEFHQKIKQIYDNFEVMYKLYSIKYKKSFAGSCSITVMQYNDHLTIINVGDSRVIMSLNGGLEVSELSKDHKPEFEGEFNRVISAGGFVYRSLWSWVSKKGYEETAMKHEEIEKYEFNTRNKPYLEIGPWRVNSGGLSVSRTFGDFESKYRELGGVPGSIICEPEIFEFSTTNADFMIIGC